MRTTILTIILSLLVAMPMNVFAMFDILEVEDKKDIELKGETEDENEKSLILPFGAYQIDNAEICVMSYDAYSNATIRILDANGWTMDAFSSSLVSMQVVSFDISSYPNGIYTLVITTPQGTYLTGTFEIGNI